MRYLYIFNTLSLLDTINSLFFNFDDQGYPFNDDELGEEDMEEEFEDDEIDESEEE